MGMFDTVYTRCPQCGTLVGFQSREGVCKLNDYEKHRVPPEIARALHGSVESCPQCNFSIRLRLTAPIPEVVMGITPNEVGGFIASETRTEAIRRDQSISYGGRPFVFLWISNSNKNYCFLDTSDGSVMEMSESQLENLL